MNQAIQRPSRPSRTVKHRQVLKDGSLKIVSKEYDAKRRLAKRSEVIVLPLTRWGFRVYLTVGPNLFLELHGHASLYTLAR